MKKGGCRSTLPACMTTAKDDYMQTLIFFMPAFASSIVL
jgi:hypothetical protein